MLNRSGKAKVNIMMAAPVDLLVVSAIQSFLAGIPTSSFFFLNEQKNAPGSFVDGKDVCLFLLAGFDMVFS